jgi:hypothetical protein
MAYIFGVLFPALGVLHYPPKVTGKVHSTTLIRLLEKLTSMQSSLCDQCIVVLLGESSGSVQGTCDDADSLELSPRITDRVFVDSECLRKEFVADFLEPCLICDLAAHHE